MNRAQNNLMYIDIYTRTNIPKVCHPKIEGYVLFFKTILQDHFGRDLNSFNPSQ